MATLEQIQARMKKLQAQAETLIAKRAQAAVDQIRGIMLKHGLTTEDIEARAKARRERAKATTKHAGNGKVKAAATKGKLPPKYRDPKTGATWSGHARPPAWIKDVKDRSKFLIGAASAAADTAVVTKAKGAASKTAAKKATTKKAVAKKVASSSRAVGEKRAAGKPKAKKTTAGSATAKTKGRKPGARKTAASKAPAAADTATS